MRRAEEHRNEYLDAAGCFAEQLAAAGLFMVLKKPDILSGFFFVFLMVSNRQRFFEF